MPKNKSEPFQYLKNLWQRLPSTFVFSKTVGKNGKICKAVMKTGGGFIDKKNNKI